MTYIVDMSTSPQYGIMALMGVIVFGVMMYVIVDLISANKEDPDTPKLDESHELTEGEESRR